jgi:predicted adenylyl cyclase CyaB
MRFTEIEVKYRADSIKLANFIKTCTSMKPLRKTFAASYDHYFCKKTKRNNRVLRYRAGDRPELTTKKKTTNRNSFHRKEVNLPLSKKATLDMVTELAMMLGLKINFSIFKESNIYWYKGYDVVYYVVYTDNTKTKELGRFIEIEMDEHYDWNDYKEAWKELRKVENAMESLGIRPCKRMRRNLYEIYG